MRIQEIYYLLFTITLDNMLEDTDFNVSLASLINSLYYFHSVEDRRSKGWGKVEALLGLLGEVDMVEIGLLMRKAILVSSLLWSAEARSDIKERDLKRLEQVDSSYLKSLVKGHSKMPKKFHHLETGTLMLRHILPINRLLYHHHMLTREKEETIQKIY